MIISAVVDESAEKIPPRVEPSDTLRKERIEVEISRFEQSCRFIGAVVEHDGSPRTLTAVGPHERHIGTAHTIVLKVLVDALNAHLAHRGGHPLPKGIVGESAGDRRPLAETSREVRGDIVFATRYMDIVMIGKGEGDDAGVHAHHQSAKRKQIEARAIGRNDFQRKHDFNLPILSDTAVILK
jgi:hypothetical protein